MEELQVTWGRAAKVWWSLLWRGMLFGGIAGFAAAFLIGMVIGLSGASVDARIWGQVASLAVGIPVGVWVVKTVLTTEFRYFRLALLPSSEALAEQKVRAHAEQAGSELAT